MFNELSRIDILKTYWGNDLEKIRVYIGVPTSGKPELEFLTSLLNLQEQLIKNNFAVIIRFQTTSMITSNRAAIVTEAIQSEADYTLWIDDDMLLNEKVWDHLWNTMQKNDEIKILGCNYPTRGSPHWFVSRHKDRGDRVATTYMDTGAVQVDFIGFGCVLMRTEVMKGLSKPWFRMDEDYGEDVYFLDKIADTHGVRPYISHDASKHIAHITKAFITFTEGRARDNNNIMMRSPTREELFGELQHIDTTHDPLQHLRPSQIELEFIKSKSTK